MTASSRPAPSDSTATGARELGLLFGLLALYLSTLNRQYQLDALDYATAARDGVFLFHPHHLLYNGFGYLVVRAVALFGRCEPLVTLAATNAVATCAAVWLCGRLVFVLTADRRLARGVALGYAVAHGIWYMATSVEVYPMAILLELLALNMIVGPARHTATRILAAALFSALAMCFHQTAIFATPAVMVLLRRRSAVLQYAAVAFGVTGLIYAAVAWTQGVRTVPALLSWLVMYAHTTQFEMGVWGGGLSINRLLGGIPGFIGAFILPAFVWKLRAFSPYRPGPLELLPLVSLLVGIALLVGLFRQAKRSRAAHAKVPAAADDLRLAASRALLLWILGHGLFTLWWESVNFEFWIMIVPPLALLVGLRLRSLPTSLPKIRKQALLALFLCLVGNLLATFYPHSAAQENGWRVALNVLEKSGLQSGDIVLTNEPALGSYASYFLKKEIQAPSLGSGGAEPAQVQTFLTQIDAALTRDRLFLLETELVDSHPGGISAAQGVEYYQPRMKHAEPIGTYPAYGARWNIYRLRPPAKEPK